MKNQLLLYAGKEENLTNYSRYIVRKEVLIYIENCHWDQGKMTVKRTKKSTAV